MYGRYRRRRCRAAREEHPIGAGGHLVSAGRDAGRDVYVPPLGWLVEVRCEEPWPTIAAERMRRSRQRRRDGLRSLRIELRETEIDRLIRLGYLERDSRDDPHAVLSALYRVFDCIFA